MIEFDGTLTRYRGTIPRIGPHVLADVAQAQLKLDRLAKTVPLDAPWTAKAPPLDSQTFEVVAAAQRLHARRPGPDRAVDRRRCGPPSPPT